MRDKCVEMSDNTNKMRDRLIELLHEMPREMMIGEAVDYFIANGVVALPYEEGQLVYVLRSKTLNGKNLYLKKEIISHYRIFKDRAYMFFKSGGLSVCDNLWKETVFLTEEEAERALKGGE